MANSIEYSPMFIKRAKNLKKRHPSLTSDLEKLEESLINAPRQGVDFGSGLYKLRLAVKSKGKGKSGGYRVITYLVNRSDTDDVIITMLTLFDKSEESSIDKEYLQKAINSLK